MPAPSPAMKSSTATVGPAALVGSLEVKTPTLVPEVRASAAIAQEDESATPPVPDYECPVCRDVMTDPVVTECGHSFCLACLGEAASARPLCPSCNQPVRNLPSVCLEMRNQIAARHPGHHMSSPPPSSASSVTGGGVDSSATTKRRYRPRRLSAGRVFRFAQHLVDAHGFHEGMDDARGEMHAHLETRMATAIDVHRLAATLFLFVAACACVAALGNGVSTADADTQLALERAEWHRRCATNVTGCDHAAWAPTRVRTIDQALNYHGAALFETHLYAWCYPMLALTDHLTPDWTRVWWPSAWLPGLVWQTTASAAVWRPHRDDLGVFAAIVPQRIVPSGNATAKKTRVDADLADYAICVVHRNVSRRVHERSRPAANEAPFQMPSTFATRFARGAVAVLTVVGAVVAPHLSCWLWIAVGRGLVMSDAALLLVMLDVAVGRDLGYWRFAHAVLRRRSLASVAEGVFFGFAIMSGTYLVELAAWRTVHVFALVAGDVYLRMRIAQYALAGPLHPLVDAVRRAFVGA